MKYNRIFLSLSAVLFTSLCVSAQERGTITIDPIKVVRSYEAVLADALKLSPVPQLPTVQSERRELIYTGINRMAPTAVELAPLTPLRAMAEPPSQLGAGHLRLGGGNYNTPLADLRYTSKRDPNFEYGAIARHFSSAGNIKVDSLRYDHAALSDNTLGVHGKRYLQKVYLHSAFQYDRQVRHFYGLQRPVEIPRDSIRQVFNRFGGNLGIKSHLVEADQVDYAANFSFYSLNDRAGQRENNLRLDGNLLIRNAENRLTFDFAVDHTAFEQLSGLSTARTLVYFQPRFNLQKSKLAVNAGLNLAMEASGGISQFRIYPHVDATYLINDVYAIAYAGLTGNTERVSYDDLVRVNPFIGVNPDIRNLNNRFQLYGGLKGSFDELTSYNVMLSYQRLEQALFYLNDTADFSRLMPVYDSAANMFNVRVALERKFSDRYAMHARFDWRNYGLSNLAAPFMQPTLALNVGGTYNLQSKLRLKAEAVVFNGVPYLDAMGEQKELKGVFDLNLGATYTYNRHFDFFLNLNNVTSARYFRWYSYPTFGFNVLGGLHLRF